MPTYTYRCNSCSYQFDKYQRMADDPLRECPTCGEHHLRKVINSPGIVFKGSGFYVTDNRNGKSANGAGSSSKGDTPATKSEGDAKAKSETTSDSKAKTEKAKSSAKTD